MAKSQAINTVTSSVPLFYEKVFLHTDRDVYAQSETIWFSAYLVNAQNNKPINYSHNLYVELIRSDSKIKRRKVIRLEKGLGNGDFELSDTISGGTYHLRAYTSWMRNFGDNFIFEKNITIINATEKKSPTSKTPILPTDPLVRFFPESGSLINGVMSVVAVKAEDTGGKGLPLTGEIFESPNRVPIAKFSCDSLGMGAFNLTPNESMNYHAEVTLNGAKQSFELPKALPQGFALSIHTIPSFIVAGINCNIPALNGNLGSYLLLEGKHGGKTYYKQQVQILSGTTLVQIPDTDFPEGIACITLYDKNGSPLGERLVYVGHPDRIGLSLNLDSASYVPRQKVTVKLKLSDNSRANLSLAAVDVSAAAINPESIIAFLELRSEIKGNIQHPQRYFDPSNINRFKQLDLLLMIQGWRNFVWKEIEQREFKIQYDVEQALTITGRVRKIWADKAMPNTNITMFAPKATGDKLFTTISDSSGRFRIDGAVFYGYQYINFTSRDHTGNKGGWIIVDSLFKSQDRMAVNLVNPFLTAPPSFNQGSLIERERARQKFTFAGINELKTVQVKGYSAALPVQNYSVTDVIQKDYGILGQFVVDRIPGAKWSMQGSEPRKITTGYYPEYTVGVSGTYTDRSRIIGRHLDDEYWGLPLDRVLKITISGNQYVFGKTYSVKALLRPGSLDIKDFDNTMANITGYAKVRNFYAPGYEIPSDQPDYRTTIHWEPHITTDEKGEATITYYNADAKSKIRLVVQGITDKGVPIVTSAEYIIK